MSQHRNSTPSQSSIPRLPFKAVWGHPRALHTPGLQAPLPMKHHEAVTLHLHSIMEAALCNMHLPLQGTCILSPQPAAGTQFCASKSPWACCPVGQTVSYPCLTSPLAHCLPCAVANSITLQSQRAGHSQVVMYTWMGSLCTWPCSVFCTAVTDRRYQCPGTRSRTV